MSGVSDAHTAEIYCEHIECGVGAALEHATQSAHERVGSVCSHRIHHHTSCTAARKRFHQCRWQCPNKVGVASRCLHSPFHSPDKPVHSSRGAEYSDAHEDSHKVGDDSHGSLESVFRSLDEGVIYIYFLSHSREYEPHDDCHEQDVGNRCAHEIHLLLAHRAESPYHSRNQQTCTSEGEQHRTVDEVDSLIETGDNNARQCREERGKQYGHEDIRGLCRPHLCPIYHDAHRNQRKSAGIQHEKHYHRVGGSILFGVELLQLFHGLESEWSGSIVKPEDIGSYVHEDTSGDGMPLWDVGEQFAEHRTEHLGKHVHHASLLANLHYSEP